MKEAVESAPVTTAAPHCSATVSPRATAIILTAILLLGVVVRVFFLVSTHFVIDSDEAIVGLMAKHIAEGASWPVFYYGQPYMGSLEPLLVAVLFSLFGLSNVALLAVPLIFSVWLIWLVYALARRVTTTEGALFAAALTALPPLALVEWSLKPRGGFIELITLGVVALLWTVDLLRRPERGRALLLGGVLGLAWWTNNQAIFFMAPIGCVAAVSVIRSCGVRRACGVAALAAAGFLIGSSPFWWVNLFGEPRFATFKVIGSQASLAESLSHLKGFFSEALPILFGARRFWSVDDIFPGATVLTFVLYGGALGAAFLRMKRGGERWLLFLFLLFMPLIFSKSSFGSLTTAPRYLIPLIPVLFVLVGSGLRGTVLGRVVCGALLLVHLASNYASNYLGGVAIPGQPFVYGAERVVRDHQPLYRWLQENGYTHIRTSYWVGYRVAFETAERVKFSLVGEPRTVRIPDYEYEFSEFDPYVLVPSEGRVVERLLRKLGYEFRRTEVGGYVVLDQLFRPEDMPPTGASGVPSGMQELRPERVTASSRQGWAERVLDGDEGTRWGSGRPQAPGMFLRFDYSTPVVISEVELKMGLWVEDVARGLLITVRDREGRECLLFDGIKHTPWDPERERFRITFPPREVTSLRLEQTGSHPVFDWSVAEVLIRGPQSSH